MSKPTPTARTRSPKPGRCCARPRRKSERATMPPGRQWLRRLTALAALASAGTVGASAASPAGDGWSAQPDEQFLLDVRIRQFKLGDGVRAYNTPEGTCIVFGDFLTTLDVP